MLAGTGAGVPTAGAGASSAAAGTTVSGEPGPVVGAALAGTGPDSDGVVVGTDSVGVGSDCQDADPSSAALGQTVSPPVVVIPTVRCSGVGCGVGCGAGSGSALGGAGSDGGGSVSVGGVSIGGGVLTGGVVGAGVGSAAGFPPLTIVVLSPVVGCGCSAEEGCSFAQTSLELRIEAKKHKTSATSRARGLQLCR